MMSRGGGGPLQTHGLGSTEHNQITSVGCLLFVSSTALQRAGVGQGTSPRPPAGEVSVGAATRELTTAGPERAAERRVVGLEAVLEVESAAAAESEAAPSRRSSDAVAPVAAASAEAPRRGGEEGVMARGVDRCGGGVAGSGAEVGSLVRKRGEE